VLERDAMQDRTLASVERRERTLPEVAERAHKARWRVCATAELSQRDMPSPCQSLWR
jgi:hypothetical protein